MESSALIDEVFEPVVAGINALPELSTPTRPDRRALVDRTPIFNNSLRSSLRKNVKLTTFSVSSTPKQAGASDAQNGDDSCLERTPYSKYQLRKVSLEQQPMLGASPQRTHSCDVLDTPGRVREFGGLRKPSSRFASIEDNIDKLVDLLTPKKRASLTSGPRHTRCFGNVALGQFGWEILFWMANCF